MILLDTDHLTILKYPESPQYQPLVDRMAAAEGETFAATIVSVEEQMRGWLALIHKVTDVHKQIPHYGQLFSLFDFCHRWQIVPFDTGAADEFKRLKKQRVRIGAMDLKIASIALFRGVRLLSANLRDYCQVPGLQVESWLE